MIKLTELRLSLNGVAIQMSDIYVNPTHIKLFKEIYADNFKCTLTSIDFGQVGANNTYVAETPETILQLIKNI